MQFAFSTGISSEKEHGIVVSNTKTTVIEKAYRLRTDVFCPEPWSESYGLMGEVLLFNKYDLQPLIRG